MNKILDRHYSSRCATALWLCKHERLLWNL